MTGLHSTAEMAIRAKTTLPSAVGWKYTCRLLVGWLIDCGSRITAKASRTKMWYMAQLG